MYRYHIGNLTKPALFHSRMLGATYGALRPQVLLQFLFKDTTGMYKQTAVDGLVWHLIVRFFWMFLFESSGDLFRRPILLQLGCDYPTQC